MNNNEPDPRKADAELARKAQELRLRVAHVNCEIRLALEEAKKRNQANEGGSKNGMLPQNL